MYWLDLFCSSLEILSSSSLEIFSFACFKINYWLPTINVKF